MRIKVMNIYIILFIFNCVLKIINSIIGNDIEILDMQVTILLLMILEIYRDKIKNYKQSTKQTNNREDK